MHKILLVEDDTDYGTTMKQYLEISGFEVIWLNSPKCVTDVLRQQKISLAVLDIMLPIQDGFSLSKEIQTLHPSLPFLFLTAKNQNLDRLTGLKLGAADYISKTCDPEELKLRIDNIIRNANHSSFSQKEYQIGEYTLYPELFKLTHPRQTTHLTKKECDLLLLLIQYNKQLIKRETILHRLWPETDFFSGRSMDVFMTRLRKYFRHDPSIQIRSIRGVGFEVFFSD